MLRKFEPYFGDFLKMPGNKKNVYIEWRVFFSKHDLVPWYRLTRTTFGPTTAPRPGILRDYLG